MKRTVALVSMLVVAAANVWLAAAPAGAAGACKKPRFSAPQSVSSNAADAPKGKVVLVTDKATEDKPITIEYSHGPAVADQSVSETVAGDDSLMIMQDAKFFNFQVVSNAGVASVNTRIEWGSPSPSDIDIRLFGTQGEEIDNSVSFNPFMHDATRAAFGGDDDNGMEQYLGLVLPRCYGFVVESRPAWSPGEDAVTLKVWIN